MLSKATKTIDELSFFPYLLSPAARACSFAHIAHSIFPMLTKGWEPLESYSTTYNCPSLAVLVTSKSIVSVCVLSSENKGGSSDICKPNPQCSSLPSCLHTAQGFIPSFQLSTIIQADITILCTVCNFSRYKNTAHLNAIVIVSLNENYFYSVRTKLQPHLQSTWTVPKYTLLKCMMSISE